MPAPVLPPPSREKFRVTVIIPLLNDFERLEQCLRALAQQTWPTDRLEVLVVDNGSDADPAPILRPFPFARLLTESQPGSYAARNTGLSAATGNVLAFTDSDCLPEPQWIDEGVRALEEQGPNVVVGGRVILFPKNPDDVTWAEDFELAAGFSQEMYIREKHYCVTANLFTTPHVFARVGTFNAQLKSGGDKEWGNRAHAKGVPLYYAENALIRHPARHSMKQLMKKRARVVGGHLAIAKQRFPEWVAVPYVMVQSCLPPVRRMLGVRRTSGLRTPRGTKLGRYARVFAVDTSLRAYSFLELLRLQFGKPPDR